MTVQKLILLKESLLKITPVLGAEIPRVSHAVELAKEQTDKIVAVGGLHSCQF